MSETAMVKGTSIRLVRPGRSACAFTIVEMLVVMIILVLLATMMAPRLRTNERRVFDAACAEVADMLTMFAQRDAVSRQPVGLSYDENRHRLLVHVYDIDPDSPSGRSEWRPDRFIRPVSLPASMELVEAMEDQAPVDISRWPIATRPGQDRPWIELVLSGPDRAMVTVSLSPYEVAPQVWSHDDDPPIAAAPIDLNAIGRMREDW